MKKIFSKILLIPAMTLGIGLMACNPIQNNENISNNPAISEDINNLAPSVDVNEAEVIINQNKNNSNFVILDVRTLDEYNEFHIKRSVHKQLQDETNFIASLKDIKKDTRILAYCRTQNRSKKAYNYMKNAGYLYVQYLQGGITSWVNANKPVEK